MARTNRKPEPEPEDLELEEPLPRLAQVTERKLTTRTYVEEEPVATDQPPPEPDRLQTFLSTIDRSRNIQCHVSHLPTFAQNGNVSTTAPGRRWVMRLDFTSLDDGSFREMVQQRVPSGGMFDFELKDGGKPITGGRWQEELAPLPVQPGAAQPVNQYPQFVVGQQGQAAPVDPIAATRAQLSLTKELVGIARDLIPEPAPAASSNGQTSTDRPIGERILEAVTLKALESDKGPGFEKIFEIFQGNREPGALETVFNSPVLQEMVRAVSPGLNAIMENYAYKQRLEALKLRRELERDAGVVEAESKPGELPPPPSSPQTAGTSQPQQQTAEQQRASKLNQRWQRTITRLLEDCADDADPLAATQNILDFEADFHDDIIWTNGPTVGQFVENLVSTPTEQLFDMCAQILPNPAAQQQVLAMKANPEKVEWLAGVQAEVKDLLSKRAPGETEEDSHGAD